MSTCIQKNAANRRKRRFNVAAVEYLNIYVPTGYASPTPSDFPHSIKGGIDLFLYFLSRIREA